MRNRQNCYKERPKGSFLNDRNKEIYRLRNEEGLSAESIANMFGIRSGRVHNIVRKMKNVLSDMDRLKNPMTETDYLESLFYPNSLILNAFKSEGVETVEDLRNFMHKIDKFKYSIPFLGERSLKIIRETLAKIDGQYLGKK